MTTATETNVASLIAEANEALEEFRTRSLQAIRGRATAANYADVMKTAEAELALEAHGAASNEMGRKAALASLLAEHAGYQTSKTALENVRYETEQTEIEATVAKYRLNLLQAQIAYHTALLSAPR